jgi:mannose-6-phosphate isomerase
MYTEHFYEVEERPWGYYKVLYHTPYTKVKELLVRPGFRSSYQYHNKRSEHWYVVSGTATITLDGETKKLEQYQNADAPVGTKHRIGNDTNEDLVFIEVQTGEYFGEDDIVRLEDDFGRSK